MVAFNKFQTFSQDLIEGKHTFASGGGATYKVLFTNTAPNASTWKKYSDVTGELSTANGYTAGGQTVSTSDADSSGTDTVSAGGSLTWTASGGSIGPFEYAVLYRSDSTNKELVGWWDNGSAVTITNGNQVTISWSSGLLTLA
jgi:hypothetical protein